jgi:branched-chain amino acid aminotransferase
MKVEERKISIDEILDAYRSGNLREAFGTGTAATIAHISNIGFEGEDFELPQLTSECFSVRVAKAMDDVRRARIEDKHGWVYRVC